VPFIPMNMVDLPPNVRQTFTQKMKNKGFYSFQVEDKSYYLLSWGEKPNPGYRLVMDGIEENQQFTKVKVSALPPEPGMIVVQMMAYPHIVGVGVGKVIFVDKQTGNEIV
jgi:hypothetical protein